MCNNEIALPAMQQLYMIGYLKAVCVPEENKSLYLLFEQMLSNTGIYFFSVNKKNLKENAKNVIDQKQINTVWMMTFAYKLPKSLLKILPGRFINFHYGILPQYRGANPILAQMLKGESESGISIHIVDDKIDTGPIILQQKIKIEEKDTFGDQLSKLGAIGANMSLKMVELLSNNTLPKSIAQEERLAQYHKKPIASDLMIDWNQMNARQILRLINSCNPWNKGAGTIINNIGICITYAEISKELSSSSSAPGTVLTLDETKGLKVVCLNNEVLDVLIISTNNGFFPSKKLLEYGIKQNDTFQAS